ncbi:MAG: hypothetical protein AB8G77_04975 [Rhodothermales bacterium]
MKTRKLIISLLLLPLYLFGCQTKPATTTNTPSSLPASQMNLHKSPSINEDSVRDFITKFDEATINYDWRALADMLSDNNIQAKNKIRDDVMSFKSQLKSDNAKIISMNRSNLSIKIKKNKASFTSTTKVLASVFNRYYGKELTFILKSKSGGTVELINGRLFLTKVDESTPKMELTADSKKFFEQAKKKVSQNSAHTPRAKQFQQQHQRPIGRSQLVRRQESKACRQAKAQRNYYRKKLRNKPAARPELRSGYDASLLSERDVALREYEYYRIVAEEDCY